MGRPGHRPPHRVLRDHASLLCGRAGDALATASDRLHDHRASTTAGTVARRARGAGEDADPGDLVGRT